MITIGTGFVGFLESMIWVLIVIGIIFPILIWGPNIESYLFPVVLQNTEENKDYFKLINNGITKDSQFISYQLDFTKLRNCTPLLDEFAWYIFDDDGAQRRIYFEIPTDRGSISRPIGFNRSEGWLTDLSSYNPANEQKIIFIHDCHPFWSTRTEITVKETN